MVSAVRTPPRNARRQDPSGLYSWDRHALCGYRLYRYDIPETTPRFQRASEGTGRAPSEETIAVPSEEVTVEWDNIGRKISVRDFPLIL